MGINLRRDPIEPRKKKIIEKKKIYNLTNQKVCITGTIPQYSRYFTKNRISQFYGNVKFSDSITLDTNYLIVGEDPGMSKLNKAKEYLITTINYKELDCLS